MAGLGPVTELTDTLENTFPHPHCRIVYFLCLYYLCVYTWQYRVEIEFILLHFLTALLCLKHRSSVGQSHYAVHRLIRYNSCNYTACMTLHLTEVLGYSAVIEIRS